jgi:hypothetical protein
LDPAVGHRLPVDSGWVDELRILAPVGQHLIALPLEIGEPQLENVRRDPLGREVGRDVPIGVEVGVVEERRQHRSPVLVFLLADDDPHRIDDLAAFVHVEPLRRGVDDHVARHRSGKHPRALQVDS